MAQLLRQCSRRMVSSHLPIRSQHMRNYPIRALSSETTGEPQYEEPPIPKPKIRVGESIKVQRARLLYQSRKRGMAENCLLLSTFADKFLDDLTDSQLKLYDTLINMPSNDWEIYYWVVGTKPTPKEYDNEVMHMLQKHARNDNMESRIRMPDLKPVQN